MSETIQKLLTFKVLLALLLVSVSGNAFLAYKLFSMTSRQDVRIAAPKSDQEKYERSRQLNSQTGVIKSTPVTFK